jgi:ABC-type arginine transport system permease subunit
MGSIESQVILKNQEAAGRTLRNLMFQVIAAIVILLTTAIGWVAIALAAREAWKQHKQARRPS